MTNSTFITQTKAWIEDVYWAWSNGISFRFNHYNDNIDRCAFFEEINTGWYQMYIYPYDDLYMPIISKERQKRLDEHPPTIYLPKEDFDELVKRLELPSESTIESIKRLMNRKAPWDEEE